MKRSSEVGSVKKALDILDLFNVNEPELTIALISDKLALPRPTVARLVATLTNAGYLKRSFNNRKYTLGNKVFRLSTVIYNTTQLTKVASPVLRDLRDKLGETVYLDILDGLERVCVLAFEGNKALRSVVPVGQRTPLYAGADGKVILAYQPAQKFDEIVTKTGLAPFTENTITDPAKLRQDLAKIRKEGVALSYAECTKGSVGIACPIWDQHGEVRAGVAVSSPQASLDEELLAYYVRELKQAARCISKHIGAEDNLLRSTEGEVI